MNIQLVKEAMGKVIAKMAAEYGEDLPKYNLHIEHWHKSNVTGEKIVHGIDNWVIDEDDLLDHIKKAKNLPDAVITVTDTLVTVERKNFAGNLGSTAKYSPQVA